MVKIVFAVQLTNKDNEQIVAERAETEGVIIKFRGDEFWIDDVDEFCAALENVAAGS